MSKELHESLTEEEILEEWSMFSSTTYAIRVGCGKLYITILYDDKKRFKRLFIQRNSKFFCDLVHRYHIEKLATYMGRRNVSQLIKDLRGEKPAFGKDGHFCNRYIAGCEASSCEDAVSLALKMWKDGIPPKEVK